MLGHDTKIDEVAGELQRRIQAGIYVVGQRLPAERELADELGASRPTVHAALLRLQADNLIEILPRAGAFIRGESMKSHISPSLASLAVSTELQDAGAFLRAVEAQGRHPLVRFLQPSRIIPADRHISARLNVPLETPVLYRSCLHLIERIPYRIMESYYPASLLGELEGHDREDLPIFQWLREHKDIHASRALEKLNCRMPTLQEATHLHINRGQPVMEIERQVWSQQSQIFEYSHIIANGMLHDFTYAYSLVDPVQSKYGI